MFPAGEAAADLSNGNRMSTTPIRILYCHCAFARIVPADVKSGVLARLAESPAEVEAVPDLCEMSARRDPRLAELAAAGSLRIAACFPRAVQGLFEAAGCRLSDTVQIGNMRTGTAGEVASELLEEPAT